MYFGKGSTDHCCVLAWFVAAPMQTWPTSASFWSGQQRRQKDEGDEEVICEVRDSFACVLCLIFSFLIVVFWYSRFHDSATHTSNCFTTFHLCARFAGLVCCAWPRLYRCTNRVSHLCNNLETWGAKPFRWKNGCNISLLVFIVSPIWLLSSSTSVQNKIKESFCLTCICALLEHSARVVLFVPTWYKYVGLDDTWSWLAFQAWPTWCKLGQNLI